MTWQPIDSAPKYTPVLVFYDHDADPYHDPANSMMLTDYAANAEGGDYFGGKGVAIARWSEGRHESDGWEAVNGYWIPGCWAAWFNGEYADHAVNALFWMPLPSPPTTEGVE